MLNEIIFGGDTLPTYLSWVTGQDKKWWGAWMCGDLGFLVINGAWNKKTQQWSWKWTILWDSTEPAAEVQEFLAIPVHAWSSNVYPGTQLQSHELRQRWIFWSSNHPLSSQSIQIDVHMLRDCHIFSRATSYFCLLGVHARNSEAFLYKEEHTSKNAYQTRSNKKDPQNIHVPLLFLGLVDWSG